MGRTGSLRKSMDTDPRIDAYIDRAAPFAQPILRHLRALVHQACPQVEESLKWGAPSFGHAGAILCQMAAFKQHASFGYWNHAQVMGADAARSGMGSYGKLSALDDLPDDATMLAHLGKAVALNEAGVKTPARRKAAPVPAPEVPEDLLQALRANPRARVVFDGLPPGARRDYVDWIVEAKREATRAKRLAQAVEWLAEGKRRHWKYEAC